MYVCVCVIVRDSNPDPARSRYVNHDSDVEILIPKDRDPEKSRFSNPNIPIDICHRNKRNLLETKGHWTHQGC